MRKITLSLFFFSIFFTFGTSISFSNTEIILLDCKFKSKEGFLKIDLKEKVVFWNSEPWEIFDIYENSIVIGKYWTGLKSRDLRRSENLLNAVDNYISMQKFLFPEKKIDLYDEKIRINRYTLNGTYTYGRLYENKKVNPNMYHYDGACSLRGDRKF